MDVRRMQTNYCTVECIRFNNMNALEPTITVRSHLVGAKTLFQLRLALPADSKHQLNHWFQLWNDTACPWWPSLAIVLKNHNDWWCCWVTQVTHRSGTSRMCLKRYWWSDGRWSMILFCFTFRRITGTLPWSKSNHFCHKLKKAMDFIHFVRRSPKK